MSGPDRRIARYVDSLVRNRRPRRFRASPEELAAMRAAAGIRAVPPGADLPDSAFLDRLGRRLREELNGEPARRTALSRRGLLLGAGTAAVAAVAGGVAGATAEGVLDGSTGARELVPAGATWQPVMAASAVEDGQAARFSTGAVEGFVVNQSGRYQAISAVCTHLGCILQQAGEGHLTCPCHRTSFRLDGSVLVHQLALTPASLPRLRTRIRDGRIEVLTT